MKRFLFLSIRDKRGVVAQVTLREDSLKPVTVKLGRSGSSLSIEPTRGAITINRKS